MIVNDNNDKIAYVFYMIRYFGLQEYIKHNILIIIVL